jgi:flagellar biogenesis protein FliO
MFASLKKNSFATHDTWAGIAGLAAFIRRIVPALARRSAVAGALEHLASLPLTAHSSLALVRLNKQTLLLGITPQGITLLTKDAAQRNARRPGSKNGGARSERRIPEELIGR